MQCIEFVWLLRDSLNLHCRGYARESTSGSIACARPRPEPGRAGQSLAARLSTRLAKTAGLGIAAKKDASLPCSCMVYDNSLGPAGGTSSLIKSDLRFNSMHASARSSTTCQAVGCASISLVIRAASVNSSTIRIFCGGLNLTIITVLSVRFLSRLETLTYRFSTIYNVILKLSS